MATLASLADGVQIKLVVGSERYRRRLVLCHFYAQYSAYGRACLVVFRSMQLGCVKPRFISSGYVGKPWVIIPIGNLLHL